jgi:hypothetical protein
MYTTIKNKGWLVKNGCVDGIHSDAAWFSTPNRHWTLHGMVLQCSGWEFTGYMARSAGSCTRGSVAVLWLHPWHSRVTNCIFSTLPHKIMRWIDVLVGDHHSLLCCLLQGWSVWTCKLPVETVQDSEFAIIFVTGIQSDLNQVFVSLTDLY